jgi:predicted dehydrogenase
MFTWGIIGGGFVARKFALALKGLPQTRLGLAYSRTEATAQGFAQDFGGIAWTTDLAEAVARPGIDAFYIATPPTSHRDHALAALAAGKPVLIEKPIAASAADASAIADAARDAGVFAMEGIWTRFLPTMAAVRELVREGRIGSPRSFEGSFGIANAPSLDDNQFNPALGGGALLHRGLYPVSLALDLLGPAELVSSAAVIGSTGVDEDVVVTLRHENGALSVARASLRATLPNAFSVEGTNGRIDVAPPIYRPWHFRLTPSVPVVRGQGRPSFEALREGGAAQTANRILSRLRPPGRAFSKPYHGNGYGHEAQAVMEAVRGGLTEHPLMPLQESVDLARLLDDARTTWGKQH